MNDTDAGDLSDLSDRHYPISAVDQPQVQQVPGSFFLPDSEINSYA